MNDERRCIGFQTLALGVASTVLMLTASDALAQRLTGTENGEWRYLGGDAGHTRSSPLDQINGDNFSDLEVALGVAQRQLRPQRRLLRMRSTAIYVDGLLYTVAAVHAAASRSNRSEATGETVWTFREPETIRYLRSPRRAYGKGVAYGKVDGRGVIYISSPAFFLWALDAKTGRPLENWGKTVRAGGFLRRPGHST